MYIFDVGTNNFSLRILNTKYFSDDFLLLNVYIYFSTQKENQANSKRIQDKNKQDIFWYVTSNIFVD